MTTVDFFKSLNYDNGLEVATSILERFPLQYGTTLGLDGLPQIRPLEFKFEEQGRLYFDTIAFYQSYKELQANPAIQICIGDQETMSYLKVSGRVVFDKDERLIKRCLEASPVLASQFAHQPELIIPYYLTDVLVQFQSFAPDLPNKEWRL
ncbi:pyridoxamine 5'-phosphate oxidase family protein [Streptococcus moroccensis]|uniref:Pyridoxamine 5'-phosphate oxidase family protein n=1 Tax=Streptococcus moroccensis TaxID=1451356 RepID=A0ABT9YQN3_9STRE|nr:pyridoxamine 5'-phosphate oxidase family protein [Streptococcus moroccensis]MDQ0222311.1 putative pyridoxamine 5'-phosphate oxidase family protein [Streptococcus moroccensis]